MNNNKEILQRVFEIYKDNGFKPYTYDLGGCVLIFKKTVGKDRYKEIRQESQKYADDTVMPIIQKSFDRNWSDKKEITELSKVFKETDEYVLIPLALVNQMSHDYSEQIH